MQAIVECRTQQNKIEGVKDTFEKENKFIKDVTDYNQWMSERKAIGSRVTRIEMFLQLKLTQCFAN